MHSTDVEPSKDYDMLVRQFKSLQRLLKSKEQQLSHYRKENADLTNQLLAVHPDVLDSEREVNQQLTDRVLELEQQIEDLEFEIKLRQEGVY